MLAYTSLYFDENPIEGRALDLWVPEQIRQPVVLCFVHGGGWRQGSRLQMHALMHAFYERGFICVSLDYRLGKDVDALAQVEDLLTGLACARRWLEGKGFAGRPFVLYGSSAGGHLALLAGLAPSLCAKIPAHALPPVAGIVASCAPVSFVPWPEIFPGIWESMQDIAGVPYAESPTPYARLSPETYFGAGSPPLLFLMGAYEHLFPNARTTAAAEHFKARGGRIACHTYEHAEHGFFYATERKAQREAFRDMLAFLATLTV